MDFDHLSQLLFPDVKLSVEEIEAKYPQRKLPEGAKVTRFAPSPTGYVHFGGLFPSTVSERLAHQSGGVFYLRIEDTDDKREVEGAAQALITTLERYGISFDEGAVLDENGNICDKGEYGPYKQSQRRDIYRAYAKKLVSEGKAYPCFADDEELAALRFADKKTEVKSKEWTPELEAEQKAQQLKMREFTIGEVCEHLNKGHKFVLRMLASGDGERKIKITDLVKGTLELPENDKDEVLLKSDGMPTYHFAHAIDDHLMGTTHVVRGEEWLPSLPRHIMLFNYLGFKLPKYLHIAQIMRTDENGNKKKLSKRDMGANMDDYTKMGYSPECVREYVMTLLNSNYEEWHAHTPEASPYDFPFSIKKMSTSGCLFDFGKLNDVSKNVISRMSAEEVYKQSSEWAREFDGDFHDIYTADPAYTLKILSIGRGGKKPRKDITAWTDIKPYTSFFFDELFRIEDELPEKYDRECVRKALYGYLETRNTSDNSDEWFERLKYVARMIGYAPEVKLYKQNPEAYGGHVGDVSMFIRLAVTGRINSPDLYEVIRIIGDSRAEARIKAFAESL